MDQEKETRQQAERSRELAQHIMRELTPAGVQVLGGSGSLEKALEKIGARMTQQAEGGALLAQLLREEFGEDTVEIFGEFDPSVGAHVGPGVIAVYYRLREK